MERSHPEERIIVQHQRAVVANLHRTPRRYRNAPSWKAVTHSIRHAVNINRHYCVADIVQPHLINLRRYIDGDLCARTGGQDCIYVEVPSIALGYDIVARKDNYEFPVSWVAEAVEGVAECIVGSEMKA